MKNILCTWVKTSDGNQYQCEILEFIYDPFHLLPALGVRAMNWKPFGNLNRAIVPMIGSIFTVQKEVKV